MTDDAPFSSARPDGRAAGDPYRPRPELADLSGAELDGRIKTAELKLYWSRHESGFGRRGANEVEWNQLKAEQARRSPAAEPWVYKHDRRDAFELTEEKTKSGGTRTTVRGTVHNPDHTIKWRTDTAYGEQRYTEIQRAAKADGRLSTRAGDDFSHLAADQYGADPEGVNKGRVTFATRDTVRHRPNYTAQGGRMNQSGPWRKAEKSVIEHSQAPSVDDRGKPQPVRIEASSTAAKGKPFRERSRGMIAYRDTPAGREVLHSEKVAYANVPDHVKAASRNDLAIRGQMNRRDEALERHLKNDRMRQKYDRVTARARTRLDQLPAGHPNRPKWEQRLQAAETRAQRYHPSNRKVKYAARAYDKQQRKLDAEIRAPHRPAREQAQLRKLARERQVNVHLQAAGTARAPDTRTNMRTVLRFHGERQVPDRKTGAPAPLRPSRAASESFTSATHSDLSKPVRIERARPGEVVVRYADPANDPANGYGQHYTRKGTGSDRLGLAARDGARPQEHVVVANNRTLVSTAAPTTDTWSRKTRAGQAAGRHAAGGGRQQYIPAERVKATAPRRQDLLPAAPPAKAPDPPVAVAKARARAASGPKPPAPTPTAAPRAADPQVAVAKARVRTASRPKAPTPSAPAPKPKRG